MLFKTKLVWLVHIKTYGAKVDIMQMFTKYILDNNSISFEQFVNAHSFESFSSNRQGAILVREGKDGTIPIVRSTTIYKQPPQSFAPVHDVLINQIKTTTGIKDLEFNNAMVEIYDSNYTNMKYHTDQALDLVEDSYICLFSCYESGEYNPRKLKIKNKTNGIISELTLDHNSIVLFSTRTNGENLHKIVLETKTSSSKSNRWLGITFRLSKTCIQQRDNNNNIPYVVSTGKDLTVATEEQRKEFFSHKRLENESIGYKWIQIDYTL